MSFFRHNVDQNEILKKYFSDAERCISLDRGEMLLEQNEPNHRLFYVRRGKLVGYLPDKLASEPVFEADAGSFVGVYSYFSEDHKSYSRIIATEPTDVCYFSGDPGQLTADEADEFLGFLFNIVVLELRSRQYFAAQMAQERQDVMNKLIKTEKLATLGQLSTGLAHELNNSIGSLSANLRQLQNEIQDLLIRRLDETGQSAFNKGLNEGLTVSAQEARDKRKAWAGKMKLDSYTAKKLAKADIDPAGMHSPEQAREVASLWNLGYILHDMGIVAGQATHVINSIKTMGISNQNWSKDVDVNRTVTDAIAILRSLTRRVTLKLDLDENIAPIEACHGELVQVWVNLIKNAIESLTQFKVDDPEVRVRTYQTSRHVKIAIEDNGAGIAPEIMEKIYEPSFTTKVEGISLGLGLGLTIVQRIVAEHSGSIRLTSVPGKTCFTVSLRKKLN